MTTGSDLTNGWVPTATDHGIKNTGFESLVTWSGADYPKVPKTYRTIYRSDGTSYQKRVWVDMPKREFTEEHPYSKSWKYKSDSVVAIGYKLNGQLKYDMNVWSAFCTVSPVWQWGSNDQISLLGKLRNEIAGSEFNLAVSLAELPESLAMIAETANRIRRGFQYLVNGNLPGALKWLGLSWKHDRIRKFHADKTKTVAQAWLELKYGWEPLVNDLYAAAQMLVQSIGTPLTTTTRVSGLKGGQIRQSIDPGRRVVVFAREECVEKRAIIARLTEIDVWGLMGAKDPASVVWEKVPFSFIIDWAIPIGDWLAARGLSQSLTGSFITCHKRTFEVSGPKMGYDQGWMISMTGGPFTQKEGSFSRSISTTLDVPLPQTKSFAQMVSWGHAANALALLTGLNKLRKTTSQSSVGQTVYDLTLVGTMTIAEVKQLQYYELIP